MSEAELQHYSGSSLTLTDMKKCTNIMKNLASLGYDPTRIGQVFSQTQDILKIRDSLDSETKTTQTALNGIKLQVQTTQKQLLEYSAMLAVMLELKTMGFTEEWLKILADILQEIAKKNKINTQDAAARFLFDIKHNYDKLLGFKLSLENITTQITDENKKLTEIQTRYAVFKDGIDSLMRLMKIGVEEKHVIYWHTLISRHHRISPTKIMDNLRKHTDMLEAIEIEEQKLASLSEEVQQYEIKKAASLKALQEIQETISLAIRANTENIIKDAIQTAVLSGVRFAKTPSIFQSLIKLENNEFEDINRSQLMVEVEYYTYYYVFYPKIRRMMMTPCCFQ